MAEPVCIVPAGDRTGEGAVWHESEKALYWTDINRFLVHRYDPATKAVRSWFFPEPAVAVALTDRADTLLVALASKLILWQPANNARADFSTPEKKAPRARLNDGRPDPAGFFWVGSMQNNVRPDGGSIPIDDDGLGSLYRISGDGHPRTFKEGIGIANTLCWSPDRKSFYTADTVRATSSRYGITTRRTAALPMSVPSSPDSSAASRTAPPSTRAAISGTPAGAAAASSA
jgi:sugar lactone lactonase YvrE